MPEDDFDIYGEDVKSYAVKPEVCVCLANREIVTRRLTRCVSSQEQNEELQQVPSEMGKMEPMTGMKREREGSKDFDDNQDQQFNDDSGIAMNPAQSPVNNTMMGTNGMGGGMEDALYIGDLQWVCTVVSLLCAYISRCGAL